MAYLVLAYPEVRDEDFKQIQDYRKNNDELYFKVVNEVKEKIKILVF